MKRLMSVALALLLVISGLFTTSVWGAEQESDMVLAYSNNGYETAYYYYYADGTLASKKMGDDGVYTYEYREDGSLKKETLIYAGEEESYVTEYDTKGNPTAKYSLSGANRSVQEEYQNFYDDVGRPKEIHRLSGETGYITQYTYLEDGSWEVEESDYLVYSQQWILHCQMFTTYNADGLVIEERLTWSDMESMDSTESYEYDAHGNPTVHTSGRLEDDGSHTYIKRSYKNSYDAKGNLVKTQVWLEDSSMGKKQQEKIITYTYNAQGLLTKKVTHDVQDDYDTTDLWEYDSYGYLGHFKGSVYVDEGIGKGYYNEEEQWFDYQPLKNVLYK